MKIQCACGAKYSFDATPEMLQNPVRFVCPSCGRDSSDYVNELVRRQFAGQSLDAPISPKLKISRSEPESPEPSDTAAAPVAEGYCPKHPGEAVTNHCAVCGKPMCPQCMKLFGYVCSPLCNAKAEAKGIPLAVSAN